MGNYIICNGELYHYGVPGMKWGVRKSEYKSMSRVSRKKLRDNYFKTDHGREALGRLTRNTVIGTVLGGPVVGAVVGAISLKRISEAAPSGKTVSKAKSVVDKNSDKTVRELTSKKQSDKKESKRVASIKSRVTGKKEDGKPAFLMNEKELADFTSNYEKRRQSMVSQYKKATNNATKQKLQKQLDAMENDYLSVVEQDFWYSDD